jgi:hypothetical protein
MVVLEDFPALVGSAAAPAMITRAARSLNRDEADEVSKLNHLTDLAERKKAPDEAGAFA